LSDKHTQLTSEGERFLSPLHRLEFPHIEPPRPGSAVPVAEGLLWLRLPLPFELNHINVWLLDDGDGWTLVDTGLAVDASKAAWARLEAEALGSRALKRIFLTHNHPDHMGLAAWLALRHGAAVWASEKCYVDARDYLETEPAKIIGDTRRFLRSHGAMPSGDTSETGRDDHRAWHSGVPTLGHAPVDGDELSAAGTSWRLYRTDGHSAGHMCLHSAGRSLLISGDQLLPTISSNVGVFPDDPDANPLNDYLESLTRLESCAADTLVLPSHGRPFLGLHRRTRDLHRHHLEQLDAVRALCVEPCSAQDVLPTMFGRVLRGMHRVLAVAEAVAHLHYLMYCGELERTRDGDGVIRFVVN
jgi:glyoxylase-like metal-dependent hydrolase (beta-lactamase superfamily II)